MNSAKAICLQDIADKVGVSRATVSLALRDAPSISSATRLRIREVAEGLGYKPNPMVSALMTHQRATRPAPRTHLTLAMLLRFSRQGDWQAHVPQSLLVAAATRAEQHGYRLEELWLDDLQLSSQRLNNLLFARGIPGVIVAPLPVAHGHLRLDWPQFSAVAIDSSLLRPALHRVTTNRFDAMRLAVRRLRRLGYQRLGLAMTAEQDARVDHHWSAAFLWEQQQMPANQRLPACIVQSRDWNERAFGKWCKAHKPDVILGCDPTAISWLERVGKRVPADAGFVHLAVPDQASHCAGIYHDPPAMGAAAVDTLVSLIKRNERGIPEAPQTVLLETCWTDGNTLRSAAVTARDPLALPGSRSLLSGLRKGTSTSRSVSWPSPATRATASLLPPLEPSQQVNGGTFHLAQLCGRKHGPHTGKPQRIWDAA